MVVKYKYKSLYLYFFTILQTIYLVVSYHYEDDQVTLVEDVIGAYELKSVKNLISNSTKEIKDSIRLVQQNVSITSNENKDNKELDKKIKQLQETVDSLKDALATSSEYMHDTLYKGLKDSMQSIKNQLIQGLSDTKLFVEHTSRQQQTLLRRTGLAAEVILASDCSDLYNLRYNASGAYFLAKFGTRVLCDMETDGGGWLVIQRRAKVTEQVNFQRDWFSYKEGFGSLDTEFWIGNDVLHILTNQKPYEIRIEMEDYENGTYYASYSSFRVGNEDSNYMLDIGNYTGNATDAFAYHHGRQFSTIDRDNDQYESGSCSTYFSGGWWYDKCYDTHLNGVYPEFPNRKNATFITWWARQDGKKKVPLVLTNVIIKIRPSVH